MSDCFGIKSPTIVNMKKANIKLYIGPANTTNDFSSAGLLAKT